MRTLAPALGVIGLVNVQLAIADGEVFVLEANPRASRTVPFASKAIGVNLVAAACALAAGKPLADLDLPWGRTPAEVSVKAAVLPFTRFPGSDPVLGPEMRSTGEVMASAADFPTAFAKAERAAGRRLPDQGTVFLSVRDDEKEAVVPVARALAGLGFDAGRHHRAPRPRSRPPGSARARCARSPRRGGADGRRPRSAGAAATSSSTRRRARAPARTATASARRRSSPACRASRRSPARPRPPRRSPAHAASRALSLQERHAQARSA